VRKEKSPALVNALVLATTVVSLSTAVINLWAAALKPPTTPASLPATCQAPAAPQVIQYLGTLPALDDKAKEPSRPAGQ
jgi:hypothetical protein